MKQNAFFIHAGFFVELHTKEVIAMTANGHTELGKILFQKHNFFKIAQNPLPIASATQSDQEMKTLSL